MELPPLFFKGKHAYVPTAPVEYLIESKTPGLGLPVSSKRTNWRIGIFGCFNAHDVGINCLCAHCCCSIWTWENAINLVPEVEGEEGVLRNTVKQDAMRSVRDAAAENGSRSVLADVFIAGKQVDNTFSRSDVRKQLFSVLYDDWVKKDGRRVVTAYSPYQENDGRRFFYTACCAPCAAVQVVDAVQTWGLEKYGQPLYYGPITWDCKCCSLYTPWGIPVRSMPYPGNALLGAMNLMQQEAPAEKRMVR
jgi:hypothetical protein